MDNLHRLLDLDLALPAEYGGALSNHLPMALHALRELGADDVRLIDFHQRYARRFEDRPPARPARTLDDWRAARGRIDSFDALRAGFLRQLEQTGTDATLRALLPELWPGVAAAAFHGLIRTAHAVQMGHAGETAAGLAYWAARWQALPAPNAAARTPMDFTAWTRQLEALAPITRCSGRLISERITEVVLSPDYRSLAAAAPAGPALLSLGSPWAASLYARSGNFTVLHLVTALRAVRVLWPWVDDEAGAAAHLQRALLAATLASNLKFCTSEPPVRDWQGVRAAACLSHDEHVIKLVHACVEGHGHFGPGDWLHAASRVLG